jgi:hypothetical protein
MDNEITENEVKPEGNQGGNNNISVHPTETSDDLSIQFENKETEVSKQQALGAQYSKECDFFNEKIQSLLEDAPEELKCPIENFLQKMESAGLTLEQKRNLLSFATCKFAFSLKDTKHPDNLKDKIDKILSSEKYHPSLKTDIDILLTHTDGIIRQYKESVARQQTASDFGVIVGGDELYKNNYDHALNEYFKGNITEEEFLKYTNNAKAQYRKTLLLKTAKEMNGWEPVKHHMNMGRYFSESK